MKEKNSQSDKKHKALFGVIGLIVACFLVPLFWPQVTGTAQPAKGVIHVPTIKVERVEHADIIYEEKRKTDSAALEIARELPALVKTLNREKKKNQDELSAATQEPTKLKIAVRLDGKIYEPVPKYYKGVAIIDMDELLPRPEKKDTVSTSKIKKRNKIQMAIDFIGNGFRTK